MRLIDADALKNDHHMGDECDKCETKWRECQYDYIYSKMDFCTWIDDAPTIDADEKRIEGLQKLVDQNTERCEELRKQLREAHESYEKHINELEVRLQTIDAVEVKHGEWIDEPIKGVRYHCSVCSGRFDYMWKYCPNCGAKMNGERRDDA